MNQVKWKQIAITVFFTAFIFKLLGILDLGWWLVTFPIWLAPVLIVIFCVAVIVVIVTGYLLAEGLD